MLPKNISDEKIEAKKSVTWMSAFQMCLMFTFKNKKITKIIVFPICSQKLDWTNTFGTYCNIMMYKEMILD